MILSDPAGMPMSRGELCDYLQVTSAKLDEVLNAAKLPLASRRHPWRRICSEVLGINPFGLHAWHKATSDHTRSEILQTIDDIELKLREPLLSFDQMACCLGYLPDTLGKSLRQGRLSLPFTLLSFGERTRRCFPLEVLVWRDEGIAINLPVGTLKAPHPKSLDAEPSPTQGTSTPQKAIFGGFGAHNRKQNR